MESRDVVLIEWEDAQGMSDWQSPPTEEEIPDFEVLSVGFLLHENDKFVTIVQSYDDQNADHILSIPRSHIRNMKTIRRK